MNKLTKNKLNYLKILSNQKKNQLTNNIKIHISQNNLIIKMNFIPKVITKN